jgi:hypothetical protein
MDMNDALARLGLTGGEDSAGLERAYGQRLATAQEELVSARTDAERQHCQGTLSGLVEAYEYLTGSGFLSQSRADEPNATLMRDAPATPPPTVSIDPPFHMGTGSVLSGRLEVGPMLGQGGMGYVYAARDRLRDEDVAIKVLRQDLIFSTAAKERFLAEARLSSNLSHPNIVRVYDVGECGGHYYLSMERLHGHTLRQRIEAYRRENRPFSLAETTDVAHQLVDALRYAHRYIVHRDLKPENVWLADDGIVKLMDFGIAHAFSNSNMTQTGMTLGTAYYMAPEQRLDAKEVDWRADQYALGVMLYELLTGTIPMGAVKSPDHVRRDVPLRVAQAVMRAMSPKAEDRWPSLADLLAQLEAPAPKSSKAALWLLLGLGLAAAAAGGAYYLKGRDAGTQLAAAPEVEPLAPSLGTGQPPPGEPPGEPPADPPQEPRPAQAAPGPAGPAPEGKAGAAVAAASVAAATEARGDPAPARETMVERVAMVSGAETQDARRKECIAQCERDDGQCRSISRRGKQDCLRAVGFGSTGGGGLTTAPGAENSACAFFTEDRCRLAPNHDDCLSRTRSRQLECAAVVRGSFASGVQGCDAASRDGESMCLAQLRECRTYCD